MNAWEILDIVNISGNDRLKTSIKKKKSPKSQNQHFHNSGNYAKACNDLEIVGYWRRKCLVVLYLVPTPSSLLQFIILLKTNNHTKKQQPGSQQRGAEEDRNRFKGPFLENRHDLNCLMFPWETTLPSPSVFDLTRPMQNVFSSEMFIEIKNGNVLIFVAARAVNSWGNEKTKWKA